MDSIGTVASATAILAFVSGAINYFVLNPLNESIEKLGMAIMELRRDIRSNEERRQVLEIKVAELDQRARSAHHRIDTLEKAMLGGENT